MVESFDEFCGHSPIWDENLLLNNSYPEFTECFQNTLLVWVPCGLVRLMLPLYLHFLITVEGQPLPLSCLNVSKTFFVLLLFFLSGVDLLFAANDHEEDQKTYSTAIFVGGSIKAATFLLAALLTQIERLKGVITSGVLFIFWFLTTLAGIIPFYTLIIKENYNDELFRFTLNYVNFAIILIQLILVSIAEKQQRRSYQTLGKEQSQETTASFPSRLTFDWITSLVVKIYRNGIKEEELWEQHPRDQSSTVIPKFQKAWKAQVAKFQKTEQKRKPLHGETSFMSHRLSERTPLLDSGNKNYTTKSTKADKKKENTKGPSLFMALTKTF